MIDIFIVVFIELFKITLNPLYNGAPWEEHFANQGRSRQNATKKRHSIRSAPFLSKTIFSDLNTAGMRIVRFTL